MLKEKISPNEIWISELLQSFFLGFVPVIILEYTQTNFDVVELLTTLNPGDNIVIYFFCLLIFQIVVWLVVVNIYQLKPNENILKAVNKLHNFSHKLGFAIHGIYRVLAGAIPAALIMLLLQNGLTQGWERITILSFVLALSCFWICLGLEKVSIHTAPKYS